MAEREKTQTTCDAALRHWTARLGISEYNISIQRITEEQVTEVDGSIGSEFVGISTDHLTKVATLYHTRDLYPDDLVHELLHVSNPDWDEDQINAETEVILSNYLEG